MFTIVIFGMCSRDFLILNVQFFECTLYRSFDFDPFVGVWGISFFKFSNCVLKYTNYDKKYKILSLIRSSIIRMFQYFEAQLSLNYQVKSIYTFYRKTFSIIRIFNISKRWQFKLSNVCYITIYFIKMNCSKMLETMFC